MTLLEAFNENLLNEYTEPERKGVQKGDKIGQFRSRFKACLFSIYDLPQKEIAKRVGISYSFFRRIKSEEDFDSHLDEFSDIFIEDCLFLYTSTGTFYSRRYATDKAPYEHKGALAIPTEEAFNDAKIYSKMLKEKIANYLIEAAKSNRIGENVDSLDRILCLLSQWEESELNKHIFKSVSNKCNEQICETLKSKEITKEMAHQAIVCTELISKFANIL